MLQQIDLGRGEVVKGIQLVIVIATILVLVGCSPSVLGTTANTTANTTVDTTPKVIVDTPINTIVDTIKPDIISIPEQPSGLHNELNDVIQELQENKEGVYSKITYEDYETFPGVAEGYGIFGSTVEFNGLRLGKPETVPITYINGTDRERVFVPNVYGSTRPKLEGFEPLLPECYVWITIAEPKVTLAPGEIYHTPVTILIPKDSGYEGRKIEARIMVRELTQRGLVKVAGEVIWFITVAK